MCTTFLLPSFGLMIFSRIRRSSRTLRGFFLSSACSSRYRSANSFSVGAATSPFSRRASLRAVSGVQGAPWRPIVTRRFLPPLLYWST